MGQPSDERTETKGFVWTPEAVKDVENFIEHLADKYLSYKKNEADADQRRFEAETKHNRNMVISLIVFLSFIVLGMSYLTLSGHVSGDALLFLIGTITGYVLMFVQRLVFAHRGKEVEELPVP
jgi:hypothetical protein